MSLPSRRNATSRSRFRGAARLTLTFMIGVASGLAAQAQDARPRLEERGPGFGGPPGGGPRGPGGPGGPGGPREDRKLVKPFDTDGNGWLNAEERRKARALLDQENAEGRGARRPGFRSREGDARVVAPGKKIAPESVTPVGEVPLYDEGTLRTLFLTFETADWEAELAAFYGTDVEVPATLVVDGKTYRDVGVGFRGASSFFTVAPGLKRSLNVSLDLAHPGQNLLGHRTLNLLNSHTDPTFLRTVLYSHIARSYLPAPKANYVRVVVNGENWGVFINAQQFNTDFTREWFGSTKGRRWKVPGSPRGAPAFRDLGDEVAAYKDLYEIKSKDNAASWADLMRLCQVLNRPPAAELPVALEPMLDVDGALRFLALDNALINSDAYWARASDFNLYQDEKGVFHLIPHDLNETFRSPGGPGMGGGGGGRGIELDPLAGADNPDRPLIQKLLAVPAWRTRYLGYVRDVAERWLDWGKLEPLARRYQALIADEISSDTRKLYSDQAFRDGLTVDAEETGPRGPRRTMSLKTFAEQRRAFLLNHPAVRTAAVP